MGRRGGTADDKDAKKVLLYDDPGCDVSALLWPADGVRGISRKNNY